jgi:hypothetical protein
MADVTWKQRLRFVFDTLDDIPDPADRLAAVDQVTRELGDLLTTVLERACWDLRRMDRQTEALQFVSERAFFDYSRRWNGRMTAAERVRWNDPLHPHRRQKVLDLTDVGDFKTPDSIATARRKRRPYRTEKR